MLDFGWTSSFYPDGRDRGYATYDHAISRFLTAAEHDTQHLMHILVDSKGLDAVEKYAGVKTIATAFRTDTFKL